jgi:hypothetical protein
MPADVRQGRLRLYCEREADYDGGYVDAPLDSGRVRENGGQNIVTLKSSGNNKIDIDFHGRSTRTQQDAHHETPQYWDMIQDDLVFQSAILQNGDGKQYPLKCTDNEPGTFDLRIDYCNPVGQCK